MALLQVLFVFCDQALAHFDVSEGHELFFDLGRLVQGGLEVEDAAGCLPDKPLLDVELKQLEAPFEIELLRRDNLPALASDRSLPPGQLIALVHFS